MRTCLRLAAVASTGGGAEAGETLFVVAADLMLWWSAEADGIEEAGRCGRLGINACEYETISDQPFRKVTNNRLKLDEDFRDRGSFYSNYTFCFARISNIRERMFDFVVHGDETDMN